MTYDSEKCDIVRSRIKRRLHKALLRYHERDDWPLFREALKDVKLGHQIGSGPDKLVPAQQPRDYKVTVSARRKNSRQAHDKRVRRGKALTQHSGLPPRDPG